MLAISASTWARDSGVGKTSLMAAPAASIMPPSTPLTMSKARRESRIVLP